MNQTIDKKIGFSTPAFYRIKVLGDLSPDWADCLRGMEITILQVEGEKPVSVLKGKVSDQAALAGILYAL